MNVCNRDCFNCPFPDCIVDGVNAQEYRAARERDLELKYRDEIAAKQRAYYEANRDEIAAKQGRLLYDFRHMHGMTQTALGKFLGGISQPTISMWETGAVPIPAFTLEACEIETM